MHVKRTKILNLLLKEANILWTGTCKRANLENEWLYIIEQNPSVMMTNNNAL